MSPGPSGRPSGMTTDAIPDLAPAAQRVRDLAANVTDDQLDGPTPCTGTTVGMLLSHLIGLSEAFRDAARKVPSQGAPGQTSPLDPDWRNLLPQRLDELVAAWREPSAAEGMAEAGGVTMPAPVAAAVAIDELVLHGWDLARATGQSYTCDPASEAVAHAFVSETVAENPDGTPGLFGPPVAVPADAPSFDKVLALSGRDPAWTPGG